MTKKKNPVVHFEMPAQDRQRMAAFYETVFGWNTKMLGPDMNDYVLVTTTETAEDGCPTTKGSINGGFYPLKPDWPAQYPSIVIAVDNINESIKAITKASGTVLGHPVEIPGVGHYVSFTDTEGNRVSILQPLKKNCDH